MHVIIATPTTNGIVAAPFVSSVVVAGLTITARGGTYSYYSVDGADVVMARNMIANNFLANTKATHLLCLDSDMRIDQNVFQTLFSSGHPFIGTGYPERRLDLEAYGEARSKGFGHKPALAEALKYNIRLTPGSHTITGNICKAERFGFGCVLIERRVLEAMIAEKIVTRYANKKAQAQAGPDRVLYDFFSEIPLDEGDRLSEDYSFCYRASQLRDIDPMAYVGEGIMHVGNFAFGGAYIDQLKKFQTDP